jgi:hypothetical protein
MKNVGLGCDECAGWPRWELISGDLIWPLAAYFETEDDETPGELLRNLSESDMPWEVHPSEFADPRTWCSAEEVEEP